MDERTKEKLAKATGDFVHTLVRIADEGNYDRDSFVKASAEVFSTMADICTFTKFGNEGCDT